MTANRRFDLKILFTSSLLFNMGAAVAALSVTLYAIRLGASPLQLGLIGMIWPSVYTFSCLVSGRLADRFPGRTLPTVGTAMACGSFYLTSTASTPLQIMILVVPAGAGFALVWPPVEAWIAHLSTAEDLRKNFGIFNICWCLGAAPGPLLAGVASDLNTSLSFGIGILLMAISGGMVFTRTGKIPRQTATPLSEAQERSRKFLYLAWIANFATYFAVGIVRSLFPKLIDQLGMSGATTGALLSAVSFSQVLMFALLSSTSWWHHRIVPLVVSQGAVLASCLLIYSTSSFASFLPVMFLLGSSLGVVYFSSIYYSLDAPAGLGTRSGLHEAIIGLGIVAGPLSGGIVAQRWTLRTPYLLSALVLASSIVVVLILWAARNMSSSAANRTRAE